MSSEVAATIEESTEISGFYSSSGAPIPTCTYASWQNEFIISNPDLGVPLLQSVECASIGLAMVVRSALGLTSVNSVVTVVATDTPYGLIGLAAARHLNNSGSSVRVVLPGDAGFESNSYSENFSTALTALLTRDVELYAWPKPDWSDITELVESSHNVIVSWNDADSRMEPWLSEFANGMNESVIPAHAVGSPCTAQFSSTELYASSTLSLGLPLTSLLGNPDLIGRHYLTDISWSRKSYALMGYQSEPLFAQQPVVQLSTLENQEL